MSKIQRVENLMAGLLMIACAVLMVAFPELGYALVIIILSVSLLAIGIRGLVYYFTMARHMVGGKMMLYKGVIMFDLGMFTMTLVNIPKIYILLYLVGMYLVGGGIDILGAIDARRTGATNWKLKLSGGVVQVLVAIACIVFFGNTDMIVYLYSAGLIYSAIIRIVSAFRRTAIVYIQ